MVVKAGKQAVIVHVSVFVISTVAETYPYFNPPPFESIKRRKHALNILRGRCRDDAFIYVLSRCPSMPQECEEIKNRMQKIISEMDLDEARTIFSTK